MTHIVYKLNGRPFLTEGDASYFKGLDILFMTNDKKYAVAYYRRELSRVLTSLSDLTSAP
jgi:hypothetical protein